MSSPLSILGKNKRVPLAGAPNHGRRGIPFKQKDRTGPESAVMDEAAPPRQPVALASDAPPTSRSKIIPRKTCVNGHDGLSDFELMSTMMQKLTQLERKVNAQILEIQCKEKKIAVLEEKLKVLQKSKDPTDSSASQHPRDPSRVEDLEQKCFTLQAQVWEMETFLSDYGLVWVGSSSEPHQEEGREEEVHHWQHLWQPAGVSVGKDFQPNFDQVVRSVHELNLLAGEGVSHIEPTHRGARLATRSPIPLSLYRNGFIMFNGPFRSYQEPSTQQCMQDLMDGYFPSELQQRFPDGVPFQLVDRREQDFMERRGGLQFPGQGKAVGGTPENTLSSVGQYPGKAVHETLGDQGGKLSMEQFLNKLPKMVIKAGKVFDIQNSLKETLQGSSSSCSPAVTVIETPALQGPRAPGDDVTLLKVREVDGGQSFLLRMLLSETVGHLRQYLDSHRVQTKTTYDIISTFPLCHYDDDSLTLLACGLTSNTTLLLRPHPQPH
ncbi:hypothetical protein AGOR_G00120990 [Albula goreensis]|uniref:UBX domain-containing protein 11 n=1 Tax=Albula goreensis TaxID=1534307 RepID=A0A8T3DKY0_9TELE|nr:hypothetical protein AGOR_G00120990 [Albula goreensis]